MAAISDEQVDYILDDLRAHGIRLEGLRDNLLDHICILLEERLEAGGSFEAEYDGVFTTFYRKDLYELEEEALFLTSLRRPHVVLTRAWFFLWAFAVVLSPYLVYVAQWWFVTRPMGDIRNSFDVLGGAMVLDLYPLLTVLVLYLTPNRFDPLIPWRSKILIGFQPLIRILPEDGLPAEPATCPAEPAT
jgi:hypothetical protein